jgi:hypothetical protein
MAQVRWSILCRESPLDPAKQTLSLTEITDSILVAGLPQGALERGGIAVAIQLQLVTMWRRTDVNTPETIQARLVVVDPSGTYLGESVDQVIDLSGNNVQFRVTSGIEIMPLRGRGFYTFRVEQRRDAAAGWSVAEEVPLYVEEAPPPS